MLCLHTHAHTHTHAQAIVHAIEYLEIVANMLTGAVELAKPTITEEMFHLACLFHDQLFALPADKGALKDTIAKICETWLEVAAT